MTTDIAAVLGTDAHLLDYSCESIPRDLLQLPGPDSIERVWRDSDRSSAVLRSLASMYGHGRLGGTGYLSILPVDQGVEHSAAASFAPNPLYFDPANVVRLAIEGGCNAVERADALALADLLDLLGTWDGIWVPVAGQRRAVG